MASVEIMSARRPGQAGSRMLDAFEKIADRPRLSSEFRGGSEWLILFGVGAPAHDAARRKQVAAGGHALLWDLGYFGDRRQQLRMSIDADHPQKWLDRTPSDGGERWSRLGIELREDADQAGPIILVGLGWKSREYLRAANWEHDKLRQLRERFPGRIIIHRPKPGHGDVPALDCPCDRETPIEQLLRGASLVVCRHSNVGVDAAVAGVPAETEDGAAAWLAGKPFTRETRLEFLHRLAWWQWAPDEAPQAWQFARRIIG